MTTELVSVSRAIAYEKELLEAITRILAEKSVPAESLYSIVYGTCSRLSNLNHTQHTTDMESLTDKDLIKDLMDVIDHMAAIIRQQHREIAAVRNDYQCMLDDLKNDEED